MTPQEYLDYHATTPVDPRVREVMWPYFTEHFGNTASRSHAPGREASRAVDVARAQVAALIHARPQDLTFTGGATESNNLALKGVMRAAPAGRPSRIVTVATEHPSVLQPCDALAREGCEIVRLAVQPDGLIRLDDLRQALRSPTGLVSVAFAHGEIGVVQPIAEIAAMVHEAGALLHTDASQAVGRIPVDVGALGIDLLSCTAHKMYGPKGIGVLYVHPDVGRLEPILHGGGHEGGLRSGTLNVPGIVGFGAAAAINATEMECDAVRITALRNRLFAGLRSAIPDLHVNGSLTSRLPNNLHVSVADVDGAMLGPLLDALAVSSGSACASGHGGPSAVLSALGVPSELARASIRFGLGRWTTTGTIEHAIAHVARTVIDLRAMAASAAARV
jgi:cysteine desulfurase